MQTRLALPACNMHAWQIGHLRENNLTTSSYGGKKKTATNHANKTRASMRVSHVSATLCLYACEKTAFWMKVFCPGFYLSVFIFFFCLGMKAWAVKGDVSFSCLSSVDLFAFWTSFIASISFFLKNFKRGRFPGATGREDSKANSKRTSAERSLVFVTVDCCYKMINISCGHVLTFC